MPILHSINSTFLLNLSFELFLELVMQENTRRRSINKRKYLNLHVLTRLIYRWGELVERIKNCWIDFSAFSKDKLVKTTISLWYNLIYYLCPYYYPCFFITQCFNMVLISNLFNITKNYECKEFKDSIQFYFQFISTTLWLFKHYSIAITDYINVLKCLDRLASSNHF